MAKRNKPRNQKQRTLSVAEMAEVLMTIPTLAEAFTQAEMELVLDDAGWVGGVQSNYLGQVDRDERSRNLIMTRARRYWRDDPMAKQAVRLWTDYCFGDTGLSYDSDDETTKSDLDTITKNKKNRKFFNAQGAKRSSNKLLVDGDVYFMVFLNTDPVSLRYLEPLQMKRIITDPDDEETILGYKRQTKDEKTLYYRDWTNEDEITVKDPDTGNMISWEADVVVYHASFDQMGKYGNGILNTVIDWTRENRKFMQARVAIVEALSKFAYKSTVKGGQAALTAIQKRLQSSFVDTGLQGGPERNPANAPGGNWMQNAGIDMTPMPRATGAGDAKQDGDNLKLMICAGVGIPQHYFGDPSTGNLATSTTMELPTLKQFMGYQQLWKDVYADLFSIMLETDSEELDLTLELPPVLDEDLGPLGTFITAFTTVFPEAKQPEVLERCLIAMGVENVDDVMKKVEQTKKENDAQQAALQAAALTAPKPPVGQPATAPQIQKAQESYDAMTRAIAELSAKI